MSAPPPGYSGESMLQGGTTPIVSVMGGGSVTAAIKKLRKKKSRKQGYRHPTGGTKKARRKRVEQEGGNHFSLVGADEYLQGSAHSMHIARMITDPVPNESYQDGTQSFTSLTPYLTEQNTKWVRKIDAPTFAYSELKSNIPTIDNIGVTTGLAQAALKIVKFAPDRLCRILDKDTSAIVLLPAVQGELRMFERIASAVRTDIKVQREKKYRVYIFSPPFFGLVPETNLTLYNLFLMYKTTLLPATWEMYLLPEYSTQNIQASTAVSKAVINNADAKNILRELVLPSTDQTKATYASSTLKVSLFPMLEPTYIIYPYTITIELSSDSADKAAVAAQKATLQKTSDKVKEKEAALKKAQEALDLAQKDYTIATEGVFSKKQIADTSSSEHSLLNQTYEKLLEEEKGANLLLNAANKGSPDFAGKAAAVAVVQEKIKNAKVSLDQALVKRDAHVEAYNKSSTEANDKQNLIPSKKGDVTKASNALEEAKEEAKKQEGKLGPKPGGATKAIKQEKGGILFSAATTTEPSLPAAYSGFRGPIQYVQTNDASTVRRSIAYRVDTSKREPTLDTMDYKEYTLLTAPPVTSNKIYTINLTRADTTGAIKMDETMNVFMGSPNAVETHVPSVNISVGAIEYSIRSPVPDVVDDWNNGIFSNDEASYLNEMKFSPRILRDAKVFGTAWKTELSNHLSMISRSNCFKDSRLLLHADCQDAQRFVSKVLEYYMNNSDDIVQLQQRQQDDLALRLQQQLEAQIAQRGIQNAVGDSIFSPDAFTKAFFPPKGTAKGSVSGQFVTSVSPIMLDKTLQTLTVFYEKEETPNAAEIAKITDLLKDTFTITPLTGENTYTWGFTKPHALSEVISQARLFIPSFKCTNPYVDQRAIVREIRVIFRGTLSERDKNLVESRLGKFTQEGEIPNRYKWTFDVESSKSQDEIAKTLALINNTNKRIFALTQNDNPDARVTALIPNLDIATNRITKTFLASMGVSSPGKKIQYVDLSMAFDTGVSHKESYRLFDMEYKRMAAMINARSGDTEYDPNFIFKDRYIFQA